MHNDLRVRGQIQPAITHTLKHYTMYIYQFHYLLFFIEEKMLFSDYKVEYIIPMIMIAFLDYIYML